MTHTSACIVLTPTRAYANEIALEGGIPADELHVTLAFLGPLDALEEADLDLLSRALHRIARITPPLPIPLRSLGRFDGDGETYPVLIHLEPTPELLELREEVCARARGHECPPDTTYPVYKPHLTLTYRKKGEPLTSAQDSLHDRDVLESLSNAAGFEPPTFTHLELWMGDEKRRYPLSGTLTLAKADVERLEQVFQQPDTGEARELYAGLTGDLVRAHHTERRIGRALEGLHTGHAAALEHLAPHLSEAGHGGALEEAFLDHAEGARTVRDLSAAR